MSVDIEMVELPENGFRCIQIASYRIYTVYWPPSSSVTLVSFVDFLGRLELSIRASEVLVIVAGDFYSKAPDWCSTITDSRGWRIGAKKTAHRPGLGTCAARKLAIDKESTKGAQWLSFCKSTSIGAERPKTSWPKQSVWCGHNARQRAL